MRRYWLGWLVAGALGALLLGAELWLRHVRPDATGKQPSELEVLWFFETPENGSIVSSPCVIDDRVYFGAIRDTGLAPRGAVIALNRTTGKPVWTFDDGGEMIHMYSSPFVLGNRLYIGEGMHANFTCKLYCLDAGNGKKEWSFPVGGHIESTPHVDAGRVYFGAGDAGLFALDEVSGKRVWHFDKSLHVDSNPAVVGGRVYAGSGVSRRFQETAVFALDADTGTELWRVPVDLPAWGSPLVDEQRVFIGLGHGGLDRSVDKPIGAVLCLDSMTGQRLWRQPLPDAVMTRPVRTETGLCVTCRDGNCYLLDQADGHVIWQKNLGSAILTTPTLLDDKLYVVASAGLVACLDPVTGESRWSFNVAAHARSSVRLYSSPAVAADGAGRHCIYFGAELVTPAGRVPTLYALRR